jgi:CBS domain-containing protein
MTRDPVCCLPSDSAQAAALAMRDRDTGIVPVIESREGRKLAGVVTDRDFCLSVVAESLNASAVPVSDCMTPAAAVCRPDEPISNVLDLMREQQVRRIPVVDDQDRIQGIVSLADLLRRVPVDERDMQESLRRISEPTGIPSKPRAESVRPAPS